MKTLNDRTALVVDDSGLNRQIIIEYLHGKNFNILEAEDGKQALEHVATGKPDIILLDLIMPVMDGFETLEELKKIGSEIPVIVITAYLKDNTYQRCLTLGAKGFLHKPVKMHELFNLISGLIENVR